MFNHDYGVLRCYCQIQQDTLVGQLFAQVDLSSNLNQLSFGSFQMKQPVQEQLGVALKECGCAG